MDRRVIIKSIITEIGESAIFDTHKILILFGENAPDYIKEFSIIHRYEQTVTEDLLKKGSTMMFGNQKYTVIDIGDVANSTLIELGHVSLYFGLEDGAELLPGSILLKPEIMPELHVGDVIEFIKE